jgi:hypothetical protein|tara:strand:- start:1402 stop:1668 length:267 start_codon:yes stop_codon:yes gene_type:complete
MEKLDDSPEVLLYESMTNSYMIITNKLSFDELLDYNGCALPFNPKKKIDNHVIDKIIDYFCILEEFEKCAELKKLKESKKYKKNFINL